MITTDTVVWVCSLIVTVGGAVVLVYKGIHKLLEPINKIKDTLEEHDEKLESHDEAIKDLREKSAKDYEALGEIREMSTLQTRCTIDMMNHMIDGNHTETMKQTRDEAINLLARQ